MDYAVILLSIAATQFLAAASPGPNFIIVTSYTISQSRFKALLVVCGILLASLAWILLAVAGLGIFLIRFPGIYNALQLASAAYLMWLGLKMLRGVWRHRSDALAQGKTLPVSNWQAVRAGLVTNMTNPKSVAYYSSLFVVMIPSDAPGWLFAAAVSTAFAVSAAWWVSVPFFFAIGPVRRSYEQARRTVDTVLGSLLIGLGLRLALVR
jgi:threonine efflux protein